MLPTVPPCCHSLIQCKNKICEWHQFIGALNWSIYRNEGQWLAALCKNLTLNTKQTKMSSWRHRVSPTPLHINLWWSHISEGRWLANTTSVVEKAQHRPQFLMVVRKNKLEERLRVTFLPRYSWECADMFHSIEIQNTLYYFTFLFYKILLLLTYKALHGQFPAYIAELLRPYSCSLFLIF